MENSQEDGVRQAQEYADNPNGSRTSDASVGIGGILHHLLEFAPTNSFWDGRQRRGVLLRGGRVLRFAQYDAASQPRIRYEHK
ncbi:MAG: hypothetical protein ACRYG7_15490 [Janthinobacterium lividum]